MNTKYEIKETLDAKGEVCPIPLAKTKQAIDTLGKGDVLEVLATERNSLQDFKSWADITDGVKLINQIEEEDDGEPVYRHYVKKIGGSHEH